MRINLLFLLFFITCFKNFGQETSDDYWTAVLVANNHYDNANYEEAVKAYDLAFQIEEREEFANHRLYAAAASCLLDKEEKVREHLFALLPVSAKKDMKRVLVNYQIFDKYKATNWWKELKQKMDARLQALIAHHQNLKRFKKGRDIRYTAIRINEQGDTLANTFVTVKPDGTGWGDEAASSQSQVVYEYDYSSQDSIDHEKELREIVTSEFWIKYDTTGVIENEAQVWIHPFRNNEFFKTELAPFPTIIFPVSAETIKEANSKIVIMRNWGTFSPSETENEYNYLGVTTKDYSCAKELPCHKFKATGLNSIHGESEIEYFFNDDLGFVEMNYKTYDGDTILFKIDKIN